MRPGKKEIWSSITYALTTGQPKYVKIYLLETSAENKRRLVGPTFHTPQEAHHFCTANQLAWPGDQRPLDLQEVLSEGLLKAWSQVWSSEVEACVRTSAESAERFVENFNVTSNTLHVRVPKTFVDQLLTQVTYMSHMGCIDGYVISDPQRRTDRRRAQVRDDGTRLLLPRTASGR